MAPADVTREDGSNGSERPPSLLPEDPRARFELDFVVNAGAATSVYRFVRDFYQRSLGDRDATSRVAMAVYELLENSIKYATNGESRLRLEIKAADEDPRALLVTLRTSNRASPRDIQTVNDRFREMKEAKDPDEHYQKLMHRSATMEGSGLGLARIWAEGGMDVDFETDDSWVTIKARLLVTPEGSQ